MQPAIEVAANSGYYHVPVISVSLPALSRWAAIVASAGCVGVNSASAQTRLSGDFSVGLIGSRVHAQRLFGINVGIGFRF